MNAPVKFAVFFRFSSLQRQPGVFLCVLLPDPSKTDLSDKVHSTIPVKVPKEGNTESLSTHFLVCLFKLREREQRA